MPQIEIRGTDFDRGETPEGGRFAAAAVTVSVRRSSASEALPTR